MDQDAKRGPFRGTQSRGSNVDRSRFRREPASHLRRARVGRFRPLGHSGEDARRTSPELKRADDDVARTAERTLQADIPSRTEAHADLFADRGKGRPEAKGEPDSTGCAPRRAPATGFRSV